MASNNAPDDLSANWLSGSIERSDNEGRELMVARSDLTAEDYAKGIADVIEVFKRNKDRSWVLLILEEHIADAYRQRTGLMAGAEPAK